MKPGLAVLPLEVWADVLVYPWITRQQLAQIVDLIGDRKFAEKLQFRLHDWGKQSLRFLAIAYKPTVKPKKRKHSKYQLRKRKVPQYRASLGVASRAILKYNRYGQGSLWLHSPAYKHCEFPECEMPENITKFKQIAIGHLDYEVLDFLAKIKPLLNNVVLGVESIKSAKNVRILFGHLLPMLGSIRGIKCEHDCIEFFERHFPGTLAQAKELELAYSFIRPKPVPIHAYVRWLIAPQNFDVHGPRFLKMSTSINIIFAIVDAVRQQFLAAATPSTFVLFLPFKHLYSEGADEFELQNAATNEQLAVRNAVFKKSDYYGVGHIHYVEIVRHPMGADAIVREWIKERAYFENNQNLLGVTAEAKQEQVIYIPKSISIGLISEENDPIDEDDDDQSAVEMTKKMKLDHPLLLRRK